jgi:hypothetical protein
MDLGVDHHFRSRLRVGMRCAQQRRPGRGQRRPRAQHGAPVDETVYVNRLLRHVLLPSVS